MEILSFIGVILVYAFFHVILNAGVKTTKALGKTVIGKGSLSDNLENEFKGMGDLRIRISDKTLNNESDRETYKSIQAKGLFPITSKAKLGVIASIFEDIDGELSPILSAIDAFQEPDSTVFQWTQEIGDCEPGWGFLIGYSLHPSLPIIYNHLTEAIGS